MNDDELRALLQQARTIAIVGASPHPYRPSHGIMALLQSRGFRTLPVNPAVAGSQILGETVAPNMHALTAPVDIVDIFRNSEAAAAVVDEAIAVRDRLSIRCVWMQIGVRNEAAAERAAAAGLDVVMDRCLAVDYLRLIA